MSDATSSHQSQPSGGPDQRYRVSQKELLSAFERNIEPVRVPATYRLGILIVAVVMVILPLIYISIIGLVGYGVYYHAVNNTAMVEVHASGRGRSLVFLAYMAPMIIGPILVLFMFKPLLSRPSKRRQAPSLAPDEEPLVFAFVQRICEAVGSSTPTRIDVDSQVNASASFRRGFLSMLGNDLVLTIGLPLVSGLSLREFAGVLAHEFGHFSQGAGMRLTYLIRSISHWFTRVVYERDAWDDKLVQWSEGIDLRIGWILYVARFFVWVTRKVLWVLMVLGQLVSGYMLRQMEFDADRHETRLAGSDAFESTARKLAALNMAMQAAHSDLGSFYREGRLGDNVPKLVMHNFGQFTTDAHQQINRLVDDSSTGWLDTHPCDKDRIASAQRENAMGIFRAEKPASTLFRDFDALSKKVTWDFYCDIFGERLNRQDLHPIDELLARQAQEHDAYQATHRFFQATFRWDRPLQFAGWSIESPADPDRTVVDLKRSREEMLASLPDYREACQRFDQALAADQEPTAAQLVPFEQAAGRRLFAALELLHASDIAGSIETAADWQEECAKLLPVLKLVNGQVEQVTRLASAHGTLGTMLQSLSEDNRDEKLINAIRAHMEVSIRLIQETRQELITNEYPFDHAKAGISIGEFALEDLPDPENPVEIYSAAEGLIGNFNSLRARLIGQLCILAEGVESTIGLDPLPEPVDQTEAAARPVASASNSEGENN